LKQTKNYFEERGQKIDYEYFDYHANCKKEGTYLLDESLRNMFKKLYLRDIGLYSEKSTNYL